MRERERKGTSHAKFTPSRCPPRTSNLHPYHLFLFIQTWIQVLRFSSTYIPKTSKSRSQNPPSWLMSYYVGAVDIKTEWDMRFCACSMWEAVYPFSMVPSENFDMLRLNYYDICSPLVKVTSICLLILLATSHHSSLLQFECFLWCS